MKLNMHTGTMVNQIYNQRVSLEKVRLIISNFQKKDGWIVTSKRSTIEIDDEVRRCLIYLLEENYVLCYSIQFCSKV